MNVPDYPVELHQNAQSTYDELYNLLKDEGRAKDKYKVAVAIAANSIYLYEKASALMESPDIYDIKVMNQVLTTINKASSEYLRAAKNLLLTPESERKIEQMPEETGRDRDSLFDMLGMPKSRNDRRSSSREHDSIGKERRKNSTKISKG